MLNKHEINTPNSVHKLPNEITHKTFENVNIYLQKRVERDPKPSPASSSWDYDRCEDSLVQVVSLQVGR